MITVLRSYHPFQLSDINLTMDNFFFDFRNIKMKFVMQKDRKRKSCEDNNYKSRN